MPFITSEAIDYLISRSIDYEITLPFFDKYDEPLFAIYSKNITERWLQQLQQGNYKLQELVNHFMVQKINVASHPLFSKKLFMNINTPDDLEKANLL
jgi:molybdopterin-guanine dinucleotide biosynthesis protein A